MPEYLLTFEENAGGQTFITRHTIEAEDRQMAKYWFHRILHEWGYTKTPFGKHCLEGPNGLHTELQEVRSLDSDEYEVLNKHLSSWPNE